MLSPVIFAIAVALAFGAIWARTRKLGVLVLAGLWLLYAGYEYLMFMRVLCTGECNIRVDLLLIYPALLAATLWQVGRMLWHAIRRKRSTNSGA
jgi:hypothetical protein